MNYQECIYIHGQPIYVVVPLDPLDDRPIPPTYHPLNYIKPTDKDTDKE